MTNEIITAIGTLGFPIVMCVMMWRQNTRAQETNERIINSLTDTINGSISALCTKIDTLISLLEKE